MTKQHYITVMGALAMSAMMYAQNYVTPVRNDITPPSPQSAAIMAVQSPEPDMLTGAVNVDIPIYTIESDGYSLPVTLKYHTNGIKVFDDPTPLGYGWTLQPALRATRTVYGRPDELYPFVPTDPQQSAEPMGMAFMCMVKDYLQSYTYKERYDSEHDVFTFALPGKTITRVLDMTSGTPVFVGANDSEYKVFADNELRNISVIDPYGNHHMFGGTYETYNEEGSKLVKTAWALNRIVCNNGQTIELRWSKVRHDVVNRSWLGGHSFMDSPDLLVWWNAPFTPEDYEYDNAEDANFTRINECTEFLQLDAIIIKSGAVLFNYATQNPIRYLNTITVNSDMGVVKTFKFSYLGGGTLLQSIDGGEGNQYEFSYNTTFGVQPLCYADKVHSQDWWGYFNAKSNGSLTPKLSIRTYSSNHDTSGSYTSQKGHADRNVDTNAMQAMILRQIVWPTGGCTNFFYEPHRFRPTRMETNGEIASSYDPYLSEGGGLRVAYVATSAYPNGINPLIVRYQYSEPTVRAVPSAATFIEVNTALVPYPGRDVIHPKLTTPLRHVNIMPFSSYMKYDEGSTPIWYEKVTAIWPEGKIEVEHKDVFAQYNVKPVVGYGFRKPGNKHSLLGISPVLASRKIFKAVGSGFEEVERTEFSYTIGEGSKRINNYHIIREKLYMDDAPESPDVPDGQYPDPGNYSFIIEDAYSCYTNTIVPYDIRPSGMTVTEFVENGTLTTSESIVYVLHTGLPQHITKFNNSGNISKTTVHYPAENNNATERQMVATNHVGLPIREVVDFGDSNCAFLAEYSRLSNGGFRKRQTKAIYSGTDTIYSPICEYDAQGNLIRATDADGVSVEWTWNSWRPTSKKEGNLLTTYNYYTLIGLSETTAPWGAKTKYTYDNLGRLIYVNMDGLGRLQDFSYSIGLNHNRITATSRLDDTHTHTITEFYDNLGRKTSSEDAATGVSQYFKYDDIGRCTAASVPSSESPGQYDYTLYSYEQSPRGKLISTTKAGSEWHDGDKSVKTRMLVNTATGGLACPKYSYTSSGATLTGNYPAGALLVEETTDENGHVTRSYVDKYGLEVMSEEGDGGSDMLRTRRIYDPLRRLRFVLPPSVADGSFTSSSHDFMMNCHEFGYDGAGRLISSRSPGMTEPDRIRYSAAGRVVAERTAAMTDGRWMVHFYDKAGRRVLSAEASLSDSQLSALQGSFAMAEYTGASSCAGYTLSPAPGFSISRVVSASYYDDYAFLQLVNDSGMPTVTASRPGLLTGTFDGENALSFSLLSIGQEIPKGTYSVFQYDAWGRMVRSDSQTEMGILTVVSTLDRVGNVLTYNQILKRNNGSVLSLNQTNSLDNAGRISQWDVSFGQASAGAAVTYGKFGSVEKEVFNNKIERTYEYDCHGWLSQVKTALPTWDVFPQASTADLSAQFYSKVTEAQVEPMAFVRVPMVYTESILYAGGNSPRYDGTASAHVSTLGGRYDYSFDCHDRLVKADYSGSGDADFSAEYAYNTLAAQVKIKRQGVIDYRSIFLTGSSGEIYGTLDDLSYQWDGARLEAVTAQASGADFYGRTGFALSAQGGTADFEWNGAGLMTADSSRGITNILYNRYGQPTRVDFTDGSRVNYTYSCSGGLLKVTSYGKPTVTRPIPLAPITAQRYYCGNFVFDADTLSYVNFPGGYFDSNGSPFYRHTDWQGSVTIVTNSRGQIEQHTGYYPYGEPWAEPDGQPYLFSGKERMRDNALNEYDFSARRYVPALALWTTPDPIVHVQLNPYSYCAGNPIRFVDPSGMTFTECSYKYIDMLHENIHTRQSDLLNELLNIFGNPNNSSSEIQSRINSITDEIVALAETSNEINILEESTQVYNLAIDEGINTDDSIWGKSAFNFSTNEFDMIVGEAHLGLIAHELKHGYQFETGELSTGVYITGKPFYDLNDEIEAYQRGALFGQIFNGSIKDNYKYLFKKKYGVLNSSISDLSNPLELQNFANQKHCAFRWNGCTYFDTELAKPRP